MGRTGLDAQSAAILMEIAQRLGVAAGDARMPSARSNTIIALPTTGLVIASLLTPMPDLGTPLDRDHLLPGQPGAPVRYLADIPGQPFTVRNRVVSL